MPLEPTSGSEWRNPREEGVVVRLPSGKVARLRPIDFSLIVRLGRLPEGLVSIAVDVIQGGPGKFEPPKTKADVEKYFNFYDAVCECCFMNPRIVAEPKGEDEISIEDLSWSDKVFAAQFLNLPAAHLAAFREEQAGNVEPLHSDAGNQTASESDSGDTTVGISDTGNQAA